MAVSSLDALGVAPEDMTPAEAKELARLMEQVRALEEGTSTHSGGRRRPCLRQRRSRSARGNSNDPKREGALPLEDAGAFSKDFAKKQQAFRARSCEKGRR